MWRESTFVRCSEAPVNQADPYTTDRYRFLRYGPWAQPGAEAPPPQLDGSRIIDGCTARVIMGTVGGSVMGLLMGGFFHTMQPLNVDTTLSTREQLRQSYKGFGQACSRMARQFGKVGAVYAGIECFMERARASKDVPNAMYAGCFTGGVLAFQAGPQAMAMGCAGFAAFSAVIETMMAH
eukprot:TRINITY_DN48422_c0_g1_i1.p1 TRINITY_DN48422_c0_g1~~TRINITY_DN48422_c0_g1_i1.p1  ORF type:complete len:205 (-),score=42.34 TRINITY_DN48422_c0_g1_i1:322-861(-)